MGADLGTRVMNWLNSNGQCFVYKRLAASRHRPLPLLLPLHLAARVRYQPQA